MTVTQTEAGQHVFNSFLPVIHRLAHLAKPNLASVFAFLTLHDDHLTYAAT